MELTLPNLLLIILTPVAVTFILMIFMAPFINKVFDRHKPIENEIKTQTEKLKLQIEEIRNKIIRDDSGNLTNEKFELYKAEIHDLKKRYSLFVSDSLKEIKSVRREESGLDDLLKELKQIKPIDGGSSAVWFLGSLLLTPLALLFASSLFVRLLGASYHPKQYLYFLIWPIIGFLLAYKGYKNYNKVLALMLCLGLNIIYAIFMTYGVLRLGGNQ